MDFKNKQKKILSQLFDIRPTTYGGALDAIKILRVKKTINLRGESEIDSERNTSQLLEKKNPISINPKEESDDTEKDFFESPFPSGESSKEPFNSAGEPPTKEELLRELAEIDKQERSKQQ